MKNVFIFVLLGSLLVVFSAAQSSSNSGQIGGHEDYDLAAGDGTFVEEATTPRPKRRRLPGGRSKPSVQSEDPALESPAAPVETSPTEKTTKRSRTSARTESTPSARSGSKPTDAPTEQPVGVTYRRPKFPPRRLPFPIKRTTTVAPAAAATEEFFYEDEPLAPEGHAADAGQHAEAPVDETIAQGAR